jgi:hypothetical protein
VAFAVAFPVGFLFGAVATRRSTFTSPQSLSTSRLVPIVAAVLVVSSIDVPALQTSILGLLSGTIGGAAILGFRGDRSE